MKYKNLPFIGFLLGFGVGSCICGNATDAIIVFTGAVIIYALSTEGKKE